MAGQKSWSRRNAAPFFYAKNEEERVVGAVIGGAIFLFGLAVGGIVGDELDRVTNGKLFDYLMERMGLK